MDARVDPARSLEAFLKDTGEPDRAVARFENESDRTLRIDVDGGVWLKPGAAIAFRGDVRFERRPALDADSLKDAVLREASPLVRAIGKGRLCGRQGSHVSVVRLAGDTILVAWDDLLAFEAPWPWPRTPGR
jgi:uncharacterized protein (AIM24 family)